ncbi:hypothetical protein ACTJJ7_24700 [Phyllobacterium sp. 22229]|uniref:hypothetical protein n=1 Tax=Phyllobacterium sp. 22229 TaxID=3453895 RepID=UPI003F856DBA
MSTRRFTYSAAIYSMIAIFPITGSFYVNVLPSVAEENGAVLASWPPVDGIDNSAFVGDPALSAPASIKLIKSNGDGDLHFFFASEGASSVYIGYQVGGKIIESWHNFNMGEPVTVRIPSNVDNQIVWISRDPKLAPFSLKRIEIVRGM